MATIGESSKVTIGLMVLILGGVVAVTALVVRIETKLASIMADRYSLSMAAEDALREAIANPGHRVPDPRKPGQYIVVEQGGVVRP